MLLLEVREESAVQDDSCLGQSADNTTYVLFLPVLEGEFRATLQGNSANELEFCVESGELKYLHITFSVQNVEELCSVCFSVCRFTMSTCFSCRRCSCTDHSGFRSCLHKVGE